jgi:hypothetical protein
MVEKMEEAEKSKKVLPFLEGARPRLCTLTYSTCAHI